MKYFLLKSHLLNCLLLSHVLGSQAFTAPCKPIGRGLATAHLLLSKDDTDNLLERARQLREEADAMEQQLRKERPVAVATTAPIPAGPEVKYDKLPGSAWTIKYRFANEPANDQRENDEEPLEYYRGELSLQLRTDGYTDVLAKDGDSSQVEVIKVWGWDEELSQEDGKRYLLFSFDAKIPSKQQKQRFYFQALLERDRNACVLKEGTVTIKQDLAESNKALNFGFFSPKGILAQFRYVGDFVAKPISVKD